MDSMHSTNTYVNLADPVYEEISQAITKTYPNSCVCWIEKINNPLLLANYLVQKQQMSYPNEIKNLFHGTKQHLINTICTHGFDAQKNKTSAYGIGTYLSTMASYSISYCRRNNRSNDPMVYMFVCDVLAGRVCMGCSNSTIDTNNYDSATDNPKNPTMYIIPHNNAILPKYVVAFFPGAK